MVLSKSEIVDGQGGSVAISVKGSKHRPFIHRMVLAAVVVLGAVGVFASQAGAREIFFKEAVKGRMSVNTALEFSSTVIALRDEIQHDPVRSLTEREALLALNEAIASRDFLDSFYELGGQERKHIRMPASYFPDSRVQVRNVAPCHL
jgi:hypothetical protein